jgi:hypothetical protein
VTRENDRGPAVQPAGSIGVAAGNGGDLNQESPKSQARWLWLPPTLILVGCAVFGLTQLLPHGRHPTRGERLLARAAAVCQAHIPPGLSLNLGGSVPTTAGGIVAAARYFHKSAAPWDRLPDNHFVAHCSYSEVKVAATSEYKSCRDGLVSLYQPPMVFVDEDGRSSPDSVTTLPC